MAQAEEYKQMIVVNDEAEGLCITHGGSTFTTECYKCKEEQRIRSEEHRARVAKANFNRLCRGAKVPEGFKGADLKNITISKEKPQEQRVIINKCKEYVNGFGDMMASKKPFGYIFRGGFGAGKTHTAIAIIRGVVLQHKMSARFAEFSKIMDDIMEAIGDKNMSVKDVIARLTTPSLLAIDDVGSRAMSDALYGRMYDIITCRFNENKPTIITSNLDEKDLKSFLGGAIMSRLTINGGEALVFDWEDFRRL